MTDLLKTPRTTTPTREDDAVPEVRRNTSPVTAEDRLALAGALAGSVALTFVLFGWIAPFDSLLGFVVVAYVLFIGLYAVLVSSTRTASRCATGSPP